MNASSWYKGSVLLISDLARSSFQLTLSQQLLLQEEVGSLSLVLVLLAGSSLSGMECTKQKPDMKDIGLSAIGLKRPGMIGTTMASKCK